MTLRTERPGVSDMFPTFAVNIIITLIPSYHRIKHFYFVKKMKVTPKLAYNILAFSKITQYVKVIIIILIPRYHRVKPFYFVKKIEITPILTYNIQAFSKITQYVKVDLLILPWSFLKITNP